MNDEFPCKHSDNPIYNNISPPMKKIKELAQSDILATLINLKDTTDRTQDLKDYLYKANPQMIDN